MIRRLLFGRDSDPYLDLRMYCRYTMADRSMSERFVYRVIAPPIWKLTGWMMEWDCRFRNRYLDIRRRQNPERYIQ